MIPAIFLTFDRDIDATISCLEAYARHWPGKNLRFLVPVNSEHSRTRLIDAGLSKIDLEPVQTVSAFVSTLRTLVKRAGAAPWLFWCNSDRIPYATAPSETLSSLAQQIASADIPEEVDAIRMTHWRDADALCPDVVEFAGIKFHAGRINEFGFWHHHFIRRRYLEDLLNSAANDLSLRGFQNHCIEYFNHSRSLFWMPHQKLMKFEETLVNSRPTLNYGLRKLVENVDIDVRRLAPRTACYSSPRIAKVNSFQHENTEALMAFLTAPLPSKALQVISAGGVGSKMFARWLSPQAEPGDLVRMHSHRRLPPPKLKLGQQVIYIFGDPRNAVMSIFGRRERRTALHSFFPKPSDELAPYFVIQHIHNLQADPGPLTAEWGLDRYVQQGFDLFRLEEHLDFWMYRLPYPILFVRYEALPKTAPAIADYLGVLERPIELKKRASDWRDLEPDVAEGLHRIYGSFAERLNSLPDAFVAEDGRFTELGSGRRFTPSII